MYRMVKKIMDFCVAFLLLLCLSIPFIIIAFWLRLSAEGKVFYWQRRIGFKNQAFFIWKFATMLQNSPQMGTGSLTLRNDPRVTTPGRFLRKTKINELPQLINVLTGDMSIVGPRPQMREDFEVYPPHVKSRIYDVKPGITGIGSIIFRDEERILSASGINPKEFYAKHIAPYKGEVELWYLNNQNFITDFKIIVLTVGVVLFPNSKYWEKAFPSLPQPPSVLLPD